MIEACKTDLHRNIDHAPLITAAMVLANKEELLPQYAFIGNRVDTAGSDPIVNNVL